jgi:hypothetical protein
VIVEALLFNATTSQSNISALNQPIINDVVLKFIHISEGLSIRLGIVFC